MSLSVVLAMVLMLFLLTCTSTARTLRIDNISEALPIHHDLTIFSLANTSIHSTQTACDAPGVLDPTIGDAVLPCQCFSSTTSGQDRSYIMQSIQLFCRAITNVDWSGADLNGVVTVYKDFWYNKDNTVEGIEVMLIKLDFWADHLDTQDQCAEKFVIDYDTCWNSMHVPVDQCDKWGENHKHGGEATSACLLWTVDADPRVNNEQIFSSLTTPAAVWPTPAVSA